MGTVSSVWPRARVPTPRAPSRERPRERLPAGSPRSVRVRGDPCEVREHRVEVPSARRGRRLSGGDPIERVEVDVRARNALVSVTTRSVGDLPARGELRAATLLLRPTRATGATATPPERAPRPQPPQVSIGQHLHRSHGQRVPALCCEAHPSRHHPARDSRDRTLGVHSGLRCSATSTAPKDDRGFRPFRTSIPERSLLGRVAPSQAGSFQPCKMALSALLNSSMISL